MSSITIYCVFEVNLLIVLLLLVTLVISLLQLQKGRLNNRSWIVTQYTTVVKTYAQY